jgi:DNA topoisomerase VI subunit A
VTDDDYHEGQIERVDLKNNEIFLTLKGVPMSQIVRFKRELNEAAEGEHGATYTDLNALRMSKP